MSKDSILSIIDNGDERALAKRLEREVKLHGKRPKEPA